MAEEEKVRKARRQEDEDDGGGGDSFTVMFTSLSIILLAFFILLKSMTAVDEQKRKVAIGSLFGTFGILPGGENFDKKGKYYARLVPLVLTGEIFQGLSSEKELLESHGYLRRPADLKVELTSDGVKVVMRSALLFGSGRVSIDPRAYPVLDRIAGILMQVENPIEIIGYVKDPVPGAVTRDDWDLSIARAVTVADYMVRGSGLDPRLIHVVGRGPYPYGEKGTPVHVPTNDTVVIFIRSEKLTLPSPVKRLRLVPGRGKPQSRPEDVQVP